MSDTQEKAFDPTESTRTLTSDLYFNYVYQENIKILINITLETHYQYRLIHMP